MMLTTLLAFLYCWEKKMIRNREGNRLFHITKEQLATLKKVAENTGATTCPSGYDRLPYTRYEIIAAHLWRCASKARGHLAEQMTAMCFLVDSRSRFDPPLPPRYFGDAVLVVVEQSQVGKLTSSRLSDVCQRIREAKENINDAYARAAIKHFKSQNPVFKYQERAVFEGPPGVFFGNPNLLITSLLNFPVRELDFGWGKEIYMGTAAQQFDGDVLIYPGFNDGSVLVSVGLQAQHMDLFRKFFYQDINEMEVATPSTFSARRPSSGGGGASLGEGLVSPVKGVAKL